MDYMIKALVLNDTARVYVVRSTDITNEAIERHDLWPSAASVLGKAMTVGLMMGGMLKGEQAVTIKLAGDGPLRQAIVDADALGNVRGYVDFPHVTLSKNDGTLAESETLGKTGLIEVIKDLKMNDFFTSSIDFVYGDLAKDFTYYFASSEQTPSVVSLGSKFDVDNKCLVCGGIIIQLLPNATEETIVAIENELHKLNEFSKVLLENDNLEDIIKYLFNDDYRVLETVDVRFKCNCSREKFLGGIVSLGTKEIESMVNEGKDIETVCHYCEEKYTFTVDELKSLLKELN